MGSLGEDLLLLAIDPGNGVLRCRGHIPHGLMGAELVALAEGGWIEVADGRLTVIQAAGLTTGDQDLDVALGGIAAARRQQRVRVWVSRPRRNITNSYLARLSADGSIQRKGSALRRRWPVIDGSRAAAVRARLDAVALGSGQADTDQAALPGLAEAIGLGRGLYPGSDNRQVRKRLREIAKTHWAADAVRRAVAAADAAASG
jgi:hypothetical protein